MGIFGHNASLGFWLRDQSLDAALIFPRRKGWKLAGRAVAGDGGLLTLPDRGERLAAAFGACLKKLPRAARRADMPASLALPDVLVDEDVLNFAEFPSARTEARALVEHRMARELGTAAADLAVAWEVTGNSVGKVTCRVRAMDRALLADIEAAASRVGLRLTRIDGWSGFASGAPELRDYPAGSAVWSDGEDWSLVCWTESDPAGFCQQGKVTELAVADIVRLSQSYGRANGQADLALVIDAPDVLTDALKSAAKRARVPVFQFAAGEARSAQVAAWA